MRRYETLTTFNERRSEHVLWPSVIIIIIIITKFV